MNTLDQAVKNIESSDKCSTKIEYIPMDKLPQNQVLEWRGVQGFGISKVVK